HRALVTWRLLAPCCYDFYLVRCMGSIYSYKLTYIYGRRMVLTRHSSMYSCGRRRAERDRLRLLKAADAQTEMVLTGIVQSCGVMKSRYAAREGAYQAVYYGVMSGARKIRQHPAR